jgi:hypothetical protein
VTDPSHGGNEMGWVINCDCGTAIRGRTEDEIVENKAKHSLTVTREQALGLAERE